MFARLTKFQIKIDKTEEGMELYKSSIVPAAKSQKGYQGIYVMVDPKTGKGVSMTLWDSEEDAIANEDSGYYQEQLVKFLGFLTEPSFIREGYEVKVQV